MGLRPRPVAWLFRRRSPPHLWRRRGSGGARRARRQSRHFRRPKPHSYRHSAGAAVGDARSDPVRVQASVDKGPWTWAVALVHGFGKVNSSRDNRFGFATAGYHARLDGALTELSYYWSIDQSRIVPKAAFEYVRASTGSLQETGGLDPVMASGATAERARVLIGAEIGRYWISIRRSWTCRPMASSSTTSRRISALSRSASAPRALSCRASARVAMAPMPARRPRSA